MISKPVSSIFLLSTAPPKQQQQQNMKFLDFKNQNLQDLVTKTTAEAEIEAAIIFIYCSVSPNMLFPSGFIASTLLFTKLTVLLVIVQQLSALLKENLPR